MSYGNIIRRIRNSKKMSLRDFGKLVGVDFAHISKIEKEESKIKGKSLSPSLDLLKQICDRSDYSFQSFLEEAGYIDFAETSPFDIAFGQLSLSGKQTILTAFKTAFEADNLEMDKALLDYIEQKIKIISN